MTRLIPILVGLSISIACGSNSSSSSASKTNVNAANRIPYEQTENAYRFAQRDMDLSPLGDFVGKTASEMKLWEREEIVKKFKKLMGPEYATMVNSWNTETPMKDFGDVLMLSGCELDNCPNNRYVIITSLSEGYVHVIHIGNERIREWRTRYSEDLDLPIPPPFAEELKAMKARK